MDFRRHLLILISICAFTLSSFAYDCKIDGIYYNLDHKNNTATVTYEEFKKQSYQGSVLIPNTIAYNGTSYLVTSIGKYAFSHCSSLTLVTIPNSVTSIGKWAFYHCSSLTSVKIPDSVTSIGKWAFYHCSSLTSVTIPDSVTSIGEYAFSKCRSLTSVTIPNSVTSIGEYAFSWCTSLASVSIPKSVTSIGERAFYHCSSLTSVKIPDSVTSIGEYAFCDCSSLTSVIIPNTVTYIDWSVFYKCNSLKEILVYADYNGSIKDVSKDKIKRVMPAETIEQYLANNPFISWDDYYANKHTKKRPMNKEEITDRISKEIEAWQKKGEFESTAQWTKRVNEKTRAKKIDSLKNIYIALTKNELTEYQQEVNTLHNSYQTAYKQYYDSLSNRYIELLSLFKSDDLNKEFFKLNSPYDADNQSFLIQTSSYGDILLPVPLSDAQSFKENWNTIKSKVSFDFAFDGKDAVLSKLTFSNDGKEYVYDSHTDAKYAVADINYNFTPLEFDTNDLDLSNLDIPEISSPEIAQTVAKKSDATGLGKKKVEVGRQSITVGNGATKSDVDVSIPRVNRNADKTFALIIANENYRREGSVPFALNDGKILAEYLKSTLGLPEKNIQLYTDASLNDIKYGVNKLTQICDAFGNQASIIVYYAGHGIPDEKTGNAHLLPVDGYGSDVSTGYSLQELYDTLGNLPSKQTLLLLDACFSGAQRDGAMMASNARGVRIKTKSNAVKGNLIVLSATQGDETAYPYEEKQHGMFTYFLLKKLNENKGDVTLGDLADYIITNVKQTSILTNDKMQTPTINVSPDLSSSWKALPIGQ